ncbi:MAG: 3-phenylpropionate/trans-cinnamate dioxygenase ferredoxin subunit [Kiritimatiellia bacterium]|jgi:3-phenylpropionate/trans-cinnamate dioxygenase ferredoxin component
MSKWVEVAKTSDFDATDRMYKEVSDDVQVGIFKLKDGKYYAIEAWCSHQKVSLVTGDIDDFNVICPLHGAEFDLRNGRHMCPPAVRPVASYPIKVDGDLILMKV